MSPLRRLGLRARLGVRRLRTGLAVLRGPGTRGTEVVELGAATLVLRPPRLADAGAWRAQRLHERDRLRPWFPVGDDWAAAHSRLAWAEQVVGLRLAARLGRARPHVVLLDGRLIGQLGVDAVDLGTASGELSGWSTPNPLGHALTRAATALVCLAALGGPGRVERLVAPVAVENRGPGLLLASLGFTCEVVLGRYRRTSTGLADHEIWVLHRTPEVLAGLRAALEQERTRPATVQRATLLAGAPVGVAPDGPGLRDAVVLARLGVRLAATRARARARPVLDWRVPLGPRTLGARVVVLRARELDDAPAWVAARRRSRARLERWTPVPGDWGSAQDQLAWAGIVHRSHRLAARGGSRMRVVTVDGVLAGEAGVVAVDFGTGTGELEVWLDAGAPGAGTPHELSRWVTAAAALDAFTCAHPVDRLQVPVAAGHRAAAATLAGVGFVEEGVLRRHRATAHGLVDHHLWVLHRDEAVLEALRARVG